MDKQIFINYLNKDKRLSDYLVLTNDYIMKDDGDVLEDENGNPIIEEKNLPIETIEEKQRIIDRIKQDNIIKDLAYIFEKNINTISFRINIHKINDYYDVFSLDDRFLKDKDVLCLIVKNYNEQLSGWVWTFINSDFPNFIGIYGIRKTVFSYILKEKGVIRKLLNGVKDKAIPEIVVPWPLEDMTNLLRKIGFDEINTSENNDYRKFLSKYATTTNYFKGNIDLIKFK